MDAATGTRREAGARPRPGPGVLLVPLGVSTTLIGIIGDLLAHTLSPESHAHEDLIVLGRGNNPWHLVLFLGIVLTALGGIRWAATLPSEGGKVLGAAMVLLLVATISLGGWSGWKAAKELRTEAPTAQHALHGAAAGSTSGGAAGHASHGAGAAGTEGTSHFGGHSHGTPGPTTEAQFLVMGRQLAEARAATAKYRDISFARAHGYIQVTQFIPGLGLHLVNLRIPNDRFDPLRPQLLLYRPDGTGGFRLAGVGYMFEHSGDVPPEGFAGGADVWHFHTDLCFLAGGSVTIAPDQGACGSLGGVFQQQTAWLLHAWVWTPNPNGVFTEYNPEVA